ncbi:MAG: DNA primase [Pseudomonadota bacterium]
MIPESFIQELLARVDIVDVVGRYVPLKKGGANYMACCPFHSEKTPSFTVSPSKQFYHCFGCGAHGTAIGFVMNYAGLGFVEAVAELAASVGMQVPQSQRDDFKPRIDTTSLTEVMTRAARYYREQLKASDRAKDYLKARGLTGEVAARFGIGYAPDDWRPLAAAFPDYQAKALVECGLVIEGDSGKRYDRFRDRIMFPILDARGNVIGFGGRVLGAGEPKYLNSPETPLFEKGRELYGLPQARSAIRETDTVIVVEGYMDVVALSQHGVDNAVATLGTATTPYHVHKLLRQADRIVFCFDGDHAGRKAAWRALEASLESLADKKSVAFLFLPAEHDPDSYVREHGAEAFRRLAAQAASLSAFVLQRLRARPDLGTHEGKARLMQEAKELLERVKAPQLRAQLAHDVVRLAGQVPSSPREAERLLGLGRLAARPVPFSGNGAPFAAVRAARPAPSPPEKKLLMLVLHHPEFIVRVPHDILSASPASAEMNALKALVDAVEDGSLTVSASLAPIMEHFRATEHQAVLAELITELNENYFDEGTIEALLNDTVDSLRQAQRAQEFEALHKKIAGNTHTPEELLRYRELLSQKQQFKQASTSSDL